MTLRFSLPRIYISYHVSTPYVVQCMTHATPCVPEMQRATAREEWEVGSARARSVGVDRNPADYVVVGFNATGTFSTNKVPEFTPDWSDVTPASAFAA